MYSSYTSISFTPLLNRPLGELDGKELADRGEQPNTINERRNSRQFRMIFEFLCQIYDARSIYYPMNMCNY